MNTYSGRLALHHLDAWRAEPGEAFLADGGAEWLAGDGVAAVEWAERVASWLPAGSLWIRLGHVGTASDSGKRTIELQLDDSGPRSEDFAGRLRRLVPPAGLESLD
jgi:tRNA A37 threonylcarbamoyladenosine biosynthesis protein TsaE